MNSKRAMAQYQHNGFTLIELLVVMTIITVLIAMLVPALGSAIQAAQRAVCLSNLRVQGAAVAHYIADHRRAFPSKKTPNPGDGMDDLAALIQSPADSLQAGPHLTYAYYGGKVGTGNQASGRLINPYVSITREDERQDGRLTRVFFCPSDIGTTQGPQNTYGNHLPTVYDSMGWSYLYNSTGNTGWSTTTFGLYGKWYTEVPNHARLILANDHAFSAFYRNQDPYNYAYWHHLTELGWGSVLFVDGHVDFLRAHRNPHTSGGAWTFRTDGQP